MNNSKLIGAVLLMAVTGVSALVACSSDSSGTPATTTTTGDKVVVRVSAAQGGTVSDKSGKATLAIPPGALAADTDISLAVAPAANGSAGEVYDFGPDGLQFLKPATLTLKGDGVTLAQGQVAAIGLLEGTTFKKLEGSTFANGVATAQVMHFTKYAIIIVDGQIVLQPPSSCTDVAAKFTNCGGDPTGTWKFLDYCIDPKVLDQLKPGGCTGWVASIDVSTTQTVTFAGGATSGTVTTSDGMSTSIITTDFPISCLSDGGSVTCSSVGDAKTVCTDSATAGNCHCVQTDTKAVTGKSTPFPDPDPASKGEYCVQNNILTSREFKSGMPTGTYFILQKL